LKNLSGSEKGRRSGLGKKDMKWMVVFRWSDYVLLLDIKKK